MERLTRPGIHVDDSAAKYIGDETRIQDVGDRLLELILNGPTLMAFSKDKLRHIMRQLYARLEQYENTGVTPGEIMATFGAETLINMTARYLGVDSDRLRALAADKNVGSKSVNDLYDEDGGEVIGGIHE